MDEFELLEELRSAVLAASTHRVGSSRNTPLPEALTDADPAIRFAAMMKIDEFAERLTRVLEVDPRFPGKTNLMLHEPSAAMMFYPAQCGSRLLLRAIRTGDPQQAIRWLLKVLGTTHADGRWITTLWNVPITGRIEVSGGTYVVPLRELPECNQKRLLHEMSPQNSPVPNPLLWKTPECALVSPLRIDRLFASSDECEVTTQSLDFARSKHDDIRRAFTLLVPISPIEGLSWFLFDDPDLEEARAASTSLGRMIEIVPRSIMNQIPPVCPKEATTIVDSFLKLPEAPSKRKLRVALDRLGQAMMRHRIGDRAVELSVALESLTCDDSKGEVTHKVSTRASRLVGGTAEERLGNSKILKKVYQIRSSLVHGGLVNDEDPANREAIEKGIIVCSLLIKRIIERGKIPDWQVFDLSDW